MKNKIVSMDEAVSQIEDGSSIGIGGASLVYKPMAIVRALVKKGVKNLTIYTLMGDVDVDMLSGVGSIKKVCAPYVGFPMIGLAPNFRRAAQNGEIEVKEYSELSFTLGIRASSMGVPFIPTRSLLGSDLLKINRDFQVYDCPVTKQKFVAVPAIKFDTALIHAYQADSIGNVQIMDGQIMNDLIAYFGKSAKNTIVTVEKIADDKEIKRFPVKTVLPHYEVDFIVEMPYGAHPSGFPPLYPPDISHITEYNSAATNPEMFKEYLDKYVYSVKNHEEYLKIAKNF